MSVLLVLRALFGIAMGGEWGVGAALAFETLPKEGRGMFSGILQEGYAVGSILASGAFALFFHSIGWRGLFILGASPALLVFYVQMRVKESPVWLAGAASRKQPRTNKLDSFRSDGVPADVFVSRCVDDGVHELLARHAGCVSDFSHCADEAALADRGPDRRVVWVGLDRGWLRFRSALGAMGSEARDYHRGPAVDSGDSAVCVRPLCFCIGHGRDF